MLDRFYRSHRKAVFRGDRETIWKQGFDRATKLAGTDIPLPDRSLIEGSQSIGDNAALYGLAMRRAIKRHIGHTWRQPDDALLEFVVLSKWYKMLEGEETPELMAARVALGTMIQGGITQLLCDIDLGQWWKLHHFGNTEGLSRKDWQIHIAGASAAAYVLMALASREHASVYLPTAHEDANLGIDLLWVEDRICRAVSVKCVAGQGKHVLAWYVDEMPKRVKGDRLVEDMRRIHMGAKSFSVEDGRPCEAVLVHVAKPADGPIKLDRDWEGLTWPDQILQAIQRRSRAQAS